MDAPFYRNLQQTAETIVDEAVKILVAQEHSFTIATQKDEVDVATSADVAVERFIKAEVHKQYPDHGFLGEEFGEENSSNEYVWVIDPLDNTKEYVRGVGEYNCLVAIERNKQLVVGVTRRMGHDVRYVCSLGNGSYANGTRIHVSSTHVLETAFVGSNMPNRKNHEAAVIHTYMKVFESCINGVYRLRPDFDDARTLGLVAQGALDGCFLLPHTDKWVDVASGILLVEEAGGRVTDWNGRPIADHDLTNGVLATNGILHEQLLTIIRKEIYAKS